MVKKLNWQGVSGKDRHQIIDLVKAAIMEGDGCILNFNILSDLALILSLEIEENRIAELHQRLNNILDISHLDKETLNHASSKEWLVFLNISFSRGKGELKQTIPDVPG